MQCPIHEKTKLKLTHIDSTAHVVVGFCIDCDEEYWWRTREETRPVR